jgi:hypothetical protein
MNAEATAVRTAKSIGAAIPGRWSAPPSDAAIRAVLNLGLVPLRFLFHTGLGRRLTTTAVLSILMVGTISLLYDHADTPNPAGLLATPTAAAKPAGPGQAAAAATGAGASGKTTLAAVAAARPAKDAGSAATAWYAAKLRLATNRVQALQQQPITRDKVKVMVMAQVTETDLPTAFVTVVRSGGGWKVP